jgi:hypothetical protein
MFTKSLLNSYKDYLTQKLNKSSYQVNFKEKLEKKFTGDNKYTLNGKDTENRIEEMRLKILKGESINQFTPEGTLAIKLSKVDAEYQGKGFKVYDLWKEPIYLSGFSDYTLPDKVVDIKTTKKYDASKYDEMTDSMIYSYMFDKNAFEYWIIETGNPKPIMHCMSEISQQDIKDSLNPILDRMFDEIKSKPDWQELFDKNFEATDAKIAWWKSDAKINDKRS